MEEYFNTMKEIYENFIGKADEFLEKSKENQNQSNRLTSKQNKKL